MNIDFLILIFTSVAAIATYYEYIYKYKMKKVIILKHLKHELTVFQGWIKGLMQLDTNFYNKHIEFITINFNYNLIYELIEIYSFINIYNNMIIKSEFMNFIKQYKINGIMSRSMINATEKQIKSIYKACYSPGVYGIYQYKFNFIEKDDNNNIYNVNFKELGKIDDISFIFSHFISDIYNFRVKIPRVIKIIDKEINYILRFKKFFIGNIK